MPFALTPLQADPALTEAIVSLFWIAVVVAVSPFVVRATRGAVPDAVALLVLGCLIGPHGLDLATAGPGVTMIREIGLGLLFLMAGSEIDPKALRSSQGGHAALTWVLSLLISFGVAFLRVPDATISVALVLALATTSTALGTLLPIITESGVLQTPLGRSVLTHGAVGEVGPILVMAALLGAHSTAGTAAVLTAFLLIAIMAVVVPVHIAPRIPGVKPAIDEGMHGTRQVGMRLIFGLLLTLMAAAAVFQIDIALGAFAAGFVLRAVLPRENHFLDRRVQVVAWSFLVPVFFVASGMEIEASAIARNPLLMFTFIGLILGVRGGTVWLRERFTPTGDGPQDKSEQIQLGLYSAVGLPIIVAVTELAVTDKILPADVASVLVAAGAFTVLIFPLLARGIARFGHPVVNKVKETVGVSTSDDLENTPSA